MKLYRVQATIGRNVNGWWRTQQVPTFYLDADIHGLRCEIDAENLAVKMLTEIAGEESQASAGAVLVEEWEKRVEQERAPGPTWIEFKALESRVRELEIESEIEGDAALEDAISAEERRVEEGQERWSETGSSKKER